MNCELEKSIIDAGQEHLLRYIPGLSAEELDSFCDQLAAVNWGQIPELAEKYVLNRPEISIPDDLTPAKFYPLKPADAATEELYSAADAKGVELLKDIYL